MDKFKNSKTPRGVMLSLREALTLLRVLLLVVLPNYHSEDSKKKNFPASGIGRGKTLSNKAYPEANKQQKTISLDLKWLGFYPSLTDLGEGKYSSVSCSSLVHEGKKIAT